MPNNTATAKEPPGKLAQIKQLAKKITVVLGDPRLPDSVKRNGKFNEEDFLTLEKLHQSLGALGTYQFEYLDNHKQMIKHLMAHPPGLVLNLCDEGFNNNALHELHVPAMLEMLGIPYTGAPPACLAICYNKALVRAFAKEMEIPVPLERYLEPDKSLTAIPFFPALVKPNLGDSSIGITQHAIVYNRKKLANYVAHLREILPNVPILIQEYLTGVEYTVGVIGNPGNFTVLPILTVDYSQLPADLPPILGYESKWEPDSPYWNAIHYKEAKLSKKLHDQLVNNATKLFARLDCRDYARFDFRADQNGTIKLLEANPNPGWCWDGKMNLMAELSGRSYADLLKLIIEVAEKRFSV
jgi:D-alanine-D-alanine ligase